MKWLSKCECETGTVSENTDRVVKNSGELGRILLETSMKSAILLAMNR